MKSGKNAHAPLSDAEWNALPTGAKGHVREPGFRNLVPKGKAEAAQDASPGSDIHLKTREAGSGP